MFGVASCSGSEADMRSHLTSHKPSPALHRSREKVPRDIERVHRDMEWVHRDREMAHRNGRWYTGLSSIFGPGTSWSTEYHKVWYKNKRKTCYFRTDSPRPKTSCSTLKFLFWKPPGKLLGEPVDVHSLSPPTP